MRLPSVFLASALLCGTAAAAVPDTVPDPAFAPAMRALFDRPLAITRGSAAALDADSPPGAVRCFRYPAVLVKEVDHGEHGDDHISVVPLAPGAPVPSCSAESVNGEVVLASSAQSYFLGAKGSFGFVVSTEGADDEPFVVHDLTKGKALYADGMAPGSVPTQISIRNGKLNIDYVRAVRGACSIPKGGAACWTAFAAETRLPPDVSHAPPPIAACHDGYAAAHAPLKYPSVLRYGMTLMLDLTGAQDVRSKTPVACGPWS